ncbi:PP2C family protein-serine/threonine phosphatase [Spirillospora sp. NPDC048911]|uniref:PP2C family protein-serine/threonine phosphatase n=1 Tax=Spirillospora sp. NPDC048911 TaxID=3364527 RepID=UPI00371FE801
MSLRTAKSMPWQEHTPQSECGKSVPAATILLILLGGILALDLALPSTYTAMPLLVAVPPVAVLSPTCPRCAALAGAAALLVAVPLGIQHAPARPVIVATSVAGILLSSSMMWIACRRQQRSDCAQADLRAVLAAMQRAVLRPVPRRLGPLAAEGHYLAAAEQAQVGGDLYDGVATPYGVRLIVGDAMGKGLGAVEKAADVLGAFRELAHNETSLTGMALRLDAYLAAHDLREEFVTALLVEIRPDGGTAELVSCGHPPPLLLSGGGVSFVDAVPSAPPLGLVGLGGCQAASVTIPLRQGDRLLLYTDGVTEARDDDGRFYPLADRVRRFYDERPGGLIAKLVADLHAHAGGRLHDDAALLLVRTGPPPSARNAEVTTDRECGRRRTR